MGTEEPRRPEDQPGVTWRPLVVEDLPTWAQLVAANEEVDQPGERYSVDDLSDELTKGSWKDPSRDSLAAFGDAGEMLAAGLVELRPGDVRTFRAYCAGWVHPEWRRRGIGTALLTWQLARAEQLVAEARGRRADGAAVPARALFHAEEQLTDRARLAARLGFSAVRYYVEMVRPLTVAGAPPVPATELGGGLELRAFSPELDEQVRLAHNEAFAEHWGSEPRSSEDWRDWSTGHRDFRGDWSFVVLDGAAVGNPVVGYALSAAYRQDWAAQGYTQGWTNLLGVRPAWRRRGVAPALLAASMNAFAASGMEYAGLGVDTENTSGALGLYDRMGYTAERRMVAYAIDL